jgi:hypothetical protein
LGKQITAGLGGKLPGARNAADVETARLGTFYSPLAGNNQEGYDARPIFYGMMLVQQFAGTRLVANRFDNMGANATAYAASAADGLRIAIFNKDMTQDLSVAIDLAGAKARRAKVWRLQGPALDATSGVTLAGATIAHGNADWQPRDVEKLAMQGGMASLAVPHASAALLFVEA